jgi:hypothetical protein
VLGALSRARPRVVGGGRHHAIGEREVLVDLVNAGALARELGRTLVAADVTARSGGGGRASAAWCLWRSNLASSMRMVIGAPTSTAHVR